MLPKYNICHSSFERRYGFVEPSDFYTKKYADLALTLEENDLTMV